MTKVARRKFHYIDFELETILPEVGVFHFFILRAVEQIIVNIVVKKVTKYSLSNLNYKN